MNLPKEDEYPVSTKRIARIAAQLSVLPLELIEPVLAELPLYHILQLHFASTAGAALHDAIQTSPTWSWLFKDHGGRLTKLWVAVNRFSMVWYGRSLIQIEPCSCWWQSSVKLQNWQSKSDDKANYIAETLEASFVNRFNTFVDHKSNEDHWPYRFFRWRTWAGQGLKRADRRAMCMYLPTILLSSLIKKNEVPKELVDMDAATFSGPDPALSPPSITFLDDAADALRGHRWTLEEAFIVLPWLIRALGLLRRAKSDELFTLGKMFDEFPDILKMPLAPQSNEPARQRHVARKLQIDARKVANSPVSSKLTQSGVRFIGRSWFRFRYAHCCVVPYNWCFDLFVKFTEVHPPSTNDSIYPSEMLPHFATAQAGLKQVYSYSDSPISRVIIVDGRTHFLFRGHQNFGLPTRAMEIEWLLAFAKCVNWIQDYSMDEWLACYRDNLTSSTPKYSKFGTWDTMADVDYEEFLQVAPVSAIAKQIQIDSRICDEIHRKNNLKLPSLLAFYLPSISPSHRGELLHLLFPTPGLGRATRGIMYESTIQKILTVLKSNPLSTDESLSEDGNFEPETAAKAPVDEDQRTFPASQNMSENEELLICEKVLENLLLVKNNQGQDDSIPRVLSELRSRIDQQDARQTKEHTISTSVKPKMNSEGSDVCYICRLHRRQSHQLLPALCRVCGDFNLSSSRLSLPHNLRLDTRTALVTGGRVNLGFHTALRLLRCGACVMVTTRYPADAVIRYRSESDSEFWIMRLKIIGADFRSASDAMEVVRTVKDILATNGARLDILINNAAQTLTDSKEKEIAAIARENEIVSDLPEENTFCRWLPKTSYIPRLRGANESTDDKISFPDLIEAPSDPSSDAGTGSSGSDVANTSSSSKLVPYRKSSWVQSMDEIPYEDLITAHSVNTFVPLILIRELLPLMKQEQFSNVHCGYIVNVSSREGIFESRKSHPAKRGKHVHTNMSKAGLNMITETEASQAWEKYEVAMNTVDPGYMSAAPEYEDAFGGERPIGWGDGAARVLWPIAIGEDATRHHQTKGKGYVVWGQFLKHFGAVRVEPGFGRG